jgi:UDP-glucose 4-epimerase
VANIGSDFEISILDLAHKIIEISGSPSKIVFLPALKEGDMTRRCPDINVMKSLLQREMTPLEQGIRNLIANRQSIAV